MLLLDVSGESVRLSLQPGLVGGSGAANNRVKESGVEASVLVTGQIHHDRHRTIGADPGGPPDVLIDPQGPDSGKALRPSDPGLGFGLDRRPGGVPGDAE